MCFRTLPRESRLFDKFAYQPDTLAHQGSVAAVLEIVDQNPRRRGRIGTAQPYFTTAMRAHEADVNLKGMLFQRLPRGVVDGDRGNYDLQVRILHPRTRSDAGDRIEQVGSHDTPITALSTMPGWASRTSSISLG